MPAILREDQQARIDELVRQGSYSNEAAVLDDALTLVERKATLRALVQEGIDAADRGEIFDHETVMRDVRQRIADIAAEKAASSSAAP